MILKKLSFLISSLSLVAVLTAENIHLMAKVHPGNREMRSLTDGLGWHLDRIDQRLLPLDMQYSPTENGMLRYKGYSPTENGMLRYKGVTHRHSL